VDQRQAGGVEVHARVACRAVGRRVQRVADDGVADRHQVHPQLVGAPGDGLQLEPGDRRFALAAAGEHPPAGEGAAAGRQVHPLARVVARVGGEGQGDLAAVGGQVAVHQRAVLLADDALLEGQVEPPQHLGAAGEQHQPGGGHVEPMHQAGVGVERLDAALEAVLAVFAPGRHRQQAGRLDGDDQRVVDVEDGGGEVGHGLGGDGSGRSCSGQTPVRASMALAEPRKQTAKLPPHA
jgi:hypothetical protein